MPSVSLLSMLSLATLLLSLFSLMNASPIVSPDSGSAAGGSGGIGGGSGLLKVRSSLDITEHSTGGTYDCAPRDIHCCEQALGHSTDKGAKGTSNEANNSGGNGGQGGGSGSGSGSNVARRSSSSSSSSNNPFEHVLQMRDVVGNFGVNCSPLAIGAISTCKSAVMCCSDMSAEGKVNAACTPLGIA